MKRNKLITMLAIFLFCLCVPDFAQAQKAAILQGETKSLMPGDSFEIPVTLSNNPGIMGCMITIEVDETNLVIDSVENGELTEDGLFDHNLGLKVGTFDILWSHTEDISEDGVLFYLKGRVAQNAKQDISIPLSYSQPDTFNEEYEDVQIKCEKIIIPIEVQGKEPQDENQKVERKKVAQTIQNILDKYQQKDFSSADKKKKKKMVKEAYTELKGLGVEQKEIEKITKEDSLKKQGDFLDRLYQETKEEGKEQEIEQKQIEQKTKEQKNSDEKNPATKQIVLLITFFVIVLSAVVVIVRPKNKK